MGRLRYLEILGRQITSDRRFHTEALCPRHRTDIEQTDIGARSKRRLQNICSIPRAAPADNFRPNTQGARCTPGRVDPSHIYLIHFNMYQQTYLLAKYSKVAMIVNFLYFNVHVTAQ